MTRYWRIGLMLAVLVCGVVVWYFTTAQVREDRAAAAQAITDRRDAIRNAVSDGQRAYSKLEMKPLSAFSTSTELVEHFESHANDADPEQSKAALKHAAEFLYYRLLQPSPAEYRSWRESYGYDMRPISEMGRVDRLYSRILKRQMPPDDPTTQVDDIAIFDEMWQAILLAEKGKARPVALVDESSGLEVVQQTVDSTWSNMPVLSGELGFETWNGVHGVGFGRNWWRAPDGGINELMQREKQADVILIGFIMEMEAGDRYPFSMTLFRTDGKWWIWRLNAHNVEYGRLLGWEY